jgi:hypothetical protein
MDLSAILGDLLPMAGGAAPEPLPSLPLGGMVPQVNAPTMAMPAMPTAPPRSLSKSHHAADFVREIAPLIFSTLAARKDPHYGAAVLNGSLRGMQVARQERMDVEQKAADKERLKQAFVEHVFQNVHNLKDPIAQQQYLQLVGDVGKQNFGLQDGWTNQIPVTKTNALDTLKAEIEKKLVAFDKDAQDPKSKNHSVAGTPQEAFVSFTLSNGNTMPISTARSLLKQQLIDSRTGKPFYAPGASDEAPENKTDYSRFLTRYALGLGKKSANDLTAQEELAAKKAYGQADDKGADPTLQAIRALALQTAQANQGTRTYSPAQDRAVNMLADDYARDSKDFIVRAQSFDTVKSAVKDPTAAGDISLIFAYMKMLDPGSVVREGEFATAQNATGIPDRLRNTYNQVVSGNRLNPAQRADFVNQAKSLYATSKQRHDRITQSYRDRAKRRGVNPDDVVIDYGSADDAPAAAPVASGAPKKIGRFTVQVGGGQ